MDMVMVEEFFKFEGIGDRQFCKVLVVEGDNFLFSYEVCEFRFFSVCKGVQLDVVDFGFSVGCKM